MEILPLALPGSDQSPEARLYFIDYREVVQLLLFLLLFTVKLSFFSKDSFLKCQLTV